MSTRTTWLLAALAVAAAAVLALVMWPSASPSATRDEGAALLHPDRPRTPPVAGRDTPMRAPMPELPPNSAALSAAAYAKAVEDGDDKPGTRAFRATVDAFVEYNRSFAEAQAKEEGLTVAEVHELTYFGLMVMRTQQWSEIEDLIGRELSQDERDLGADLMSTANREFKDAMRKLVADEAPEDARWQLIRGTQERYLREYYAITGMTPALLDDLLAGDLTRVGAPIATPPPEDIPPGPEYQPPQPRPGQTP